MDLTGARKIQLFLRVLRRLGAHFRLVDMSTHARAILARGGLPRRLADDGRPAAPALAPRPAA